MHKMKRMFFILLSFLVLSGLGGCSQKENGTQKSKRTNWENAVMAEEKELVIAVNRDSSGSRFTFGNVLMNRSQLWGGLVFQGLLVADENFNNVRKDLCEEYTISPDGKTYTFVLRDDLYWHDGEKLTVKDVVWSIETYLRLQEVNSYIKKGLEEIVGAESFVYGETETISGVSVNGDSITIKITQQDNSFLSSMAQLPVLPKHCLEDVKPEELGTCEFWKLPVGSGPYKVVQNSQNKEALLTLNENYSGKMPKIQKIRYKVLDNVETDSFNFAITSDPAVIEKYRKDSDYKIIKTGNLNYCYLYFNLDGKKGKDSERMRNKKVRQALSVAIDKESVINEIYRGTANVIDGGIPDTDSWYLEKDLSKTEYNPEFAKMMLSQVGFDFSKSLILTHSSQDELSLRLVEAIAEYWKALGILVEIVSPEENDPDRLWLQPDWYDIGLKNLEAVDYSDWYYEYSSQNELWSEVFENRTIFDVLFLALKSTKWAYERELLYQEIQSMETEEMYKIPLAIVPQYIIYNSKELFLPEMEFPDMDYYFELNISQWELLEK